MASFSASSLFTQFNNAIRYSHILQCTAKPECTTTNTRDAIRYSHGLLCVAVAASKINMLRRELSFIVFLLSIWARAVSSFLRANTAVLGMKILHHSCKPRRYVPLRAGDDFKEGDFTSLDDFLYSRGVMFVGDGQAEAAAERIKGAKNGTYLFAPTSSVEKTNFPINGDPMNAMDLSASDKRATKKKIIKIPLLPFEAPLFSRE